MKNNLSLNGQNGKLGTDVGIPAVNGNLPNLGVNQPSLNVGSQDTKPSFGWTGPEVRGGLGESLRAPGVSTPQLNSPSASLDVKSPEVGTGSLAAERPKFSMPNFNLPPLKPKTEAGFSVDADLSELETPDLSLDPNVDMNGPKAELTGPNFHLNNSGVNVQNPDVDFDGKFKWPHQKWKVPKAKGPDVDLSTPGVSVSAPDVKGHLDTPGVDVRGPVLDVPTVEADPPSGKIMWPHLKWKKPKGPNTDVDLEANLNTPQVSVPNLEGELSAPDIDLNGTRAELNGPDVDVQTPNVNVEAPSGKINWPHLKWKKPRGSADFSAPDLNLSTPNVTGEMNTPNAELQLPKAGLNSGLDVQMPHADIDAPSGQINWPHLKWKKPKVPKADVDLNPDWSSPDVDLSLPNANANISAPDVDPHLNVDAPSAKLKWPTLKKSKARSIDLDHGAHVSVPHQELNAPDVNLNMPKADLDAPKLDLDSPDIEGPSGKLKWFNFKKPKFGTLKGQKADFDADVRAPNLDLRGPDVDLKTADIDLSSPRLEGNSSDLSVGMPRINPSGPGVEVPDGKLNFPQLKLPKFSGSKFKGPELNADVNAPDIDANPNFKAPNLSLSAPNVTSDLEVPAPTVNGDLSAPNLDVDTKDIAVPGFSGPDLKLSSPIKGSGVGINGDLSAPDLSGSTPKFGEINAPAVDLNIPKSDVECPKLDLDAPDIQSPSGIFKWFNFKKPKIGSMKGEDLDAELRPPGVSLEGPGDPSRVTGLDGSVSLPDVDAKLQKGELATPNLTANAPNAQLQTPDGASDPHLGGFKLPHFKWGLKSGSATDDEGSGADSETEAPSADVPAFKFHRLPKMNIDGIPGIGDAFGFSRQEPDTKDFIVSKGIRLPKMNATSKPGEKVSVLERLQMAKDSVDKSKSGDSTLEAGGTLKLEQPAPVLGPAPSGADKLSLGLSNMLGLDVTQADAN